MKWTTIIYAVWVILSLSFGVGVILYSLLLPFV